mmetsp:Transcript_31634/g.62140  ORF Transcript_31634/g.62140 Transcript_31634/m.62140 type:complete len:221 (-) Transcript_31634:86-748(-)
MWSDVHREVRSSSALTGRPLTAWDSVSTARSQHSGALARAQFALSRTMSRTQEKHKQHQLTMARAQSVGSKSPGPKAKGIAPRRRKSSRVGRKVKPLPPTMRTYGMTGEVEGSLYARIIEPRLHAEDPRSRRWAAEALGMIGPEAARFDKALSVAANDADERVRKAAAEALSRVRGRPDLGAPAQGGRQKTASRRSGSSKPRQTSSPRRSSPKRGAPRHR